MKPKVYGNPIRFFDPFHLIKTTLLLASSCFADLEGEKYIIYNTNNIAEISKNCTFGYCKAKEKIKESSEVFLLVIPECDEGKSKITIDKLLP